MDRDHRRITTSDLARMDDASAATVRHGHPRASRPPMHTSPTSLPSTSCLTHAHVHDGAYALEPYDDTSRSTVSGFVRPPNSSILHRQQRDDHRVPHLDATPVHQPRTFACQLEPVLRDNLGPDLDYDPYLRDSAGQPYFVPRVETYHNVSPCHFSLVCSRPRSFPPTYPHRLFAYDGEGDLAGHATRAHMNNGETFSLPSSDSYTRSNATYEDVDDERLLFGRGQSTASSTRRVLGNERLSTLYENDAVTKKA